MNLRRRIFLVLFLVAAAAMSAQAQAASPMTVEEAYRAIPHKRTVFDVRNAKMNSAEAEYLQRLFLWVDRAIVAKVTATIGTSADQAYAAVWSMQSTLTPPGRFKSLQATVADSIRHEYEYLKQREAANIKTFNAANPHVQAASQGAQQAYRTLMSWYPSETDHNKQAFYDYLCALDFL
jgi:hypothetical protein